MRKAIEKPSKSHEKQRESGDLSRHIELDDQGHGLAVLGEHCVQSLGLRQRSWEAIEDKATAAILAQTA